MKINNNYNSTSNNKHNDIMVKYDYGAWVNQILNGGYDDQMWNGYIVTFMYKHIGGGFERQCSAMSDEIERFYATLVRHAVRDPRSKSERKRLPILYAFPDYPRSGSVSSLKDVKVNGGLHYHGIVLVPVETRLKVTLDMFVVQRHEHLIKAGKPLSRIHVAHIDHSPEKVVDYAMKSIEYRIPDSNQMLILPKTVSELPDRRNAA